MDCEGDFTSKDSNQLLARFQTDVIDLHPDIVHILVGTNDVYPDRHLDPCDVPAGSRNAIDSAANITAMRGMAQVSDIKVILATIPPWETDPITVGDIAYDADPSVRALGVDRYLECLVAAVSLPTTTSRWWIITRPSKHQTLKTT